MVMSSAGPVGPASSAPRSRTRRVSSWRRSFGLLDAARGGVDAVGVAGDLCGDVGELEAHRVQPLHQRGQGGVRAGRAAQSLGGECHQGAGGGSVVISDQGQCGLSCGAPQLLRVAEALDLRAQRLVLAVLGVGELEPFEGIAQLGASAVPLAQQLVQLRQALGEDGAFAPERAVPFEQRTDLGDREPVQRLPLSLEVTQPLLVGLAVHRDGRADEAGQGADGDRDTAELCAGASIAGDPSDDEHLAVVLVGAELVERGGELGVTGEGERAVDGAGVTGASAVQSAAEQHGQPGDDHRLARSGLTGQGGEAGTELERGVIDHADVADAQGGQHGDASCLQRVRGLRPRQPTTGSWNFSTSRSAKGVGARRASRT